MWSLRSGSSPRRVWAAPNSRASARRSSERSTAMMVLAPTKLRPSSIACPTPPQPSTTAVSPGRTRAVLVTAPTPVVTAQPISAATGKGTSSGIGTAADSGTTVSSAKVPRPRKARTGVPSRRKKLVVPSGNTLSRAFVPVHSQALPLAHCSHRRQDANHDRMTWSPVRTSLTPGPTACTTPAPSWPSTRGPSVVHSPAATWRSEWQTPLARSLTRTRSPLTSVSWSSSAPRSSFGWVKTLALTMRSIKRRGRRRDRLRVSARWPALCGSRCPGRASGSRGSNSRLRPRGRRARRRRRLEGVAHGAGPDTGENPERDARDEAEEEGGDAAPAPRVVEPVDDEQLGDCVPAAAHEEVVYEVHRRPGGEQIEHHDERREEHVDGARGDAQRYHGPEYGEPDDRDDADPARGSDLAESVDGGDGSEHTAVGVHARGRHQDRDRRECEYGTKAAEDVVAGVAQRDQGVGGPQTGCKPRAQRDQPDRRAGSAEEYRRDDGPRPRVTRKVAGVVGNVGRVGDVIRGARGELRHERDQDELARAGRVAASGPKQDGDGQDCVEGERDPEQRPEHQVHPVVAVDSDKCGDNRDRGHHQGWGPAKEAVQAAGDEHRVYDVERDVGEESRKERQHNAAVAELCARLHHLRQPKLRALDGVEGHEERAEEDAERPGEDCPPHRQPERWTDESDGDREELEVAQEPERSLVPDLPMTLVLWHVVDRASFDPPRQAALFFYAVVHFLLHWVLRSLRHLTTIPRSPGEHHWQRTAQLLQLIRSQVFWPLHAPGGKVQLVTDHLLLCGAGLGQAITVCGDDHGAASEGERLSPPDLVDVEVWDAILEGAGRGEDVMVAPEGIHVRGDRHEEVRACLYQGPRHFGEFHVEADHDPCPHTVEVDDQEFVSGDVGVPFATEKVRLPVSAHDVAVPVDGDGRVGDTRRRALRGAEDHGGRGLRGETRDGVHLRPL